jgi:hypothetical protein
VADALRERPARFDPSQFETFRFVAREIADDGRVTLTYALDDAYEFSERFELPAGTRVTDADRERVDGLLALLHWTAGVSYFKTAAPAAVRSEAGAPPPATARLLEALYSEGLGEFAYVNGLPSLPRPVFESSEQRGGERPSLAQPDGPRLLVPVGGGKDSVVALEIARRSSRKVTLFSVGDAVPIARTVATAGLPHLLVRRRIDPGLIELNGAGALNGHVPVTAIVTCVALLTAALHGLDTVAMANERSASQGNLAWDGVEVNHQFSKGLRAERLLRAAVAELAPGMETFSLLRPASELGIARAFAGLPEYHSAFTSCNAVFRIDPELRATSWCRDCPKCRFVFLALAPFSEPGHLSEVFGGDLLADESQYDGFALLTATGGDKPFECVGEEEESLAAIRMIADDPRWRDHAVVRRLAAEVLPRFPESAGRPADVLALSGDHEVPDTLLADVHAVLGA